MIAANDLGIQFGGDYLFQGVSFMISPGERIGLVGSNGAGKTTLMRALLGQQQTDEGRISVGRHAVIGYLPQEGVVLSDVSVREEVMKAFGEVMAMEREIEEMTTEVGGRTDHDSPEFLALLEELGELQHRFEAMNGFSATGAVDKVLMGLGFRPDDLERPCGEFSGGWQMRIELAKLLLKQPDLLMLDEPTNHLDIESLTWLETFLVTYPGSILLISHDRAFLDAITNRTFELSMGRLTAYTGNYGMYLKLRTERRQLQQAAYENQQKMIADTEKFIERFRYKATKATQVQSRVKALDRLDRVAPVEAEESSVHFSFPPAPRSGRDVVEMKHVSKSYGLLNVLNDVSFVLERGEKVAFLGRNGEGKSTFSRMIAGIEPHDGERIVGHNVSIGYFAQHQAEELDPKRTVLETLDAVATGEIRTRLRTLLGAFLFQGDDVFKSVGVLSGGEKSRLALAKLLLEPVNLLIFDEPTNHLDMRSKEVLKQALIAFDGALVIVSHDRDFLNGIVGKCVEFKDRKIREYIGGIEDYLRRHQTATIDQVFTQRSAAPAESGRAAAADNGGGLSQKERKRLEAEARNRRYAATKELRKRLATVEDAIQKLEMEKGTIEAQLNDPAVIADFDRARKLQTRLSEIVNKLTGLYDDWGKVAGEIERAEAEA
ncbi:MAG TPA: ABC-F family ATP-binding cassette domain-containing protein [Candidatus Kapabacteria bacterium]|nr:ABC-F family ATP-binding cassette domain-containing protein [Candidatus Kapabacteria bacterium]